MKNSRETRARFMRATACAVMVSAGLLWMIPSSTPVESRSSLAGLPVPTRKASQVTRLVIPVLALNQADLAGFGSTPIASVPTNTPVPTILPEATSTATPTQTSVPAGAAIRVGSENGRASLANAHQVHASIVNDGSAAAYDSTLTVTYLDASDRIMGTGVGATALKMIRPGESSTVVALGPPLLGWTHYRTSLAAQPTSPINYVHDGLTVSGLSASRAGTIITITGQLQNNSNQPVGNIKVDIGLYNADGTIVDAKVANLFTSNDAAPGASTIFGVSIVNTDGRIPTNFTYSARAEGLGR